MNRSAPEIDRILTRKSSPVIQNHLEFLAFRLNMVQSMSLNKKVGCMRTCQWNTGPQKSGQRLAELATIKSLKIAAHSQ